MTSPFHIATQGYLCKPLSISVDGYLCTKVLEPPVVPTPRIAGPSPRYIREQQRRYREHLQHLDTKDKKDLFLRQLHMEDEEILTIIKIFLECQ